MEYTTAGSAYAAYSCVNLAAPGSHGDRYRRDRASGAGIADMGMEAGWVRVPKFYILCSTFIYYLIYSANLIYIFCGEISFLIYDKLSSHKVSDFHQFM